MEFHGAGPPCNGHLAGFWDEHLISFLVYLG